MKAWKHLVHGEWMTVAEAAERLGLHRVTLERWRTMHRQPDGSRETLVAAWDHYKAVKSGNYRSKMGRKPVKHWVKGRQMTVKQAAEATGVSVQRLYNYTCVHQCSLDAAVRNISKKRQERAERKILKIIRGK